VKDASRAVGVCQSLVTPEHRAEFVARLKSGHAERRSSTRAARSRRRIHAGRGRANRFRCDWAAYRPPVPKMAGVRRFENLQLESSSATSTGSVLQRLEFAGRFPDILTDPVVGEAASNLYADARRMLKQMISERWVRRTRVIGFFLQTRCDDIEVYADESRTQVPAPPAPPAPAEAETHRTAALRARRLRRARDSGVKDWIGAFAVTTGIGLDEKVREFERATTTTPASC